MSAAVEASTPATPVRRFMALTVLDGEPKLRQGLTKRSAAEIAAGLVDEVFASAAGTVKIEVSVS